ncbi:MAG: transcription elongation factor GreA [Petrotogales bacterium]
MADKIILTKDGIKKLRRELDTLIKKKRPEIAKRIAQAKDYGDLSENVEYDEAKNEQMMVERRITEITQLIKRANIAEDSNGGSEVGVGSTVAIDLDGNKIEYILVGSFEADPKEGKISHSSPIGKALMGAKKGEEVEIDIPAGKKKCKILEIR